VLLLLATSTTDTAQVVAAVAAVVQTIIVTLVAGYGVVQLVEARRARRVSAIMPIFERLHSPEATARRRRLYQEIGPAGDTLTPEQETVLQAVIADFYFVGYLVEKELVEFRLMADLYYGTVVRCWQICEPYIMRDRVRRGTYYASYFETFYRRCVDYREKHRADEVVQTFEIPPTTPPATAAAQADTSAPATGPSLLPAPETGGDQDGVAGAEP
jgi:hypothetical protein